MPVIGVGVAPLAALAALGVGVTLIFGGETPWLGVLLVVVGVIGFVITWRTGRQYARYAPQNQPPRADGWNPEG